jgi:crotonobetainyl-CoA:carnitine CoA-transferase CaiB-like acyl-CoA transferase
MLGDIIAKLDRVQVIDKLETAGVSCGPINDIAEVFADPHVRARGARIDQQREDGSQISSTAFAAKLGVTPAQYRTAPPRLGQHNEQVMQEWASLGADAVAALRAAKVM